MDQQGLLRMELTGQETQGAADPEVGGEAAGSREGREAARPQQRWEEVGLEEAVELGPSDSYSQRWEEGPGTQPALPRGREVAAPGGGATAGPKISRRREGWGERDEGAGKGKLLQSGSGKDPGKLEDEAREPGDQQPSTSRGTCWERSQERYGEWKEKPGAQGTEQVQHPLTKPGRQKTPALVETQENESFTEKRRDTSVDRESAPQVCRPTIRLSIRSRAARQSLWSVSCTSPSLFNQLAKMGDPDVLEMVQQEGRSRSGARGGSDSARGPCHRRRRDPGRRWRPCGLELGDVRRVASPARGRACKTSRPCPAWVGGFGAS